MITHLRAENFKPWRSGELRLAPLTGLFGTNNSGKTSLLQILPMLKQTTESADLARVLDTGDEDSPVYLGTFYDIIHGHQWDATLAFSLSWALPEPLIINNPKSQGTPLYTIPELSFTTMLRWESDRPIVEHFVYEFEGHRFGMRRCQGTADQYELTCGDYQLEPIQTPGPLLPAPIKCYGFPPEAMGYFKNTGFLPAFQLAFERLFARVHYLGSVRDYPQRTYEWGGNKPADAGWDGSAAIPALLASHSQESVEKSMRELGLVETLEVEEVVTGVYRCYVKVGNDTTKVLLPDVGFGVSQLLPVLVNCSMLAKGSTLVLEHPEMHLHPFAQAALADVLINAVTTGKLQIIVESHSEHFLRRLQLRIAEEKIASEQVALYFCRLDNGLSTIEALDIDPYGSILNWPKDFFGDEMGELSKMTLAAMQRRKGARQSS
jgi:AAA ATPase domain/Protein of unknown function (DUF3696)